MSVKIVVGSQWGDEAKAKIVDYLAADAVCEELGIDKWWKEPDHVKNAREKGLL